MTTVPPSLIVKIETLEKMLSTQQEQIETLKKNDILMNDQISKLVKFIEVKFGDLKSDIKEYVDEKNSIASKTVNEHLENKLKESEKSKELTILSPQALVSVRKEVYKIIQNDVAPIFNQATNMLKYKNVDGDALIYNHRLEEYAATKGMPIENQHIPAGQKRIGMNPNSMKKNTDVNMLQNSLMYFGDGDD